MPAGAIKKDDRNNRMLADAKSQVDRVKATLPQQEAEAKAIKTGEPEAKLATAYFTLKNYAKATEAAQRAVTKGNLKRADDVNMMLGISLANSKKAAEAKKAFTAAAAANTKTRGVADLWSSLDGLTARQSETGRGRGAKSPRPFAYTIPRNGESAQHRHRRGRAARRPAERGGLGPHRGEARVHPPRRRRRDPAHRGREFREPAARAADGGRRGHLRGPCRSATTSPTSAWS